MPYTRILLFIILFTSVKVSMGKQDDLFSLSYNILSDKVDSEIKAGRFVITGTVKMFSSLSPLNNVLIGSTISRSWVRSKEDGTFEIELKMKDSVIYFYKDGWSEVIIDDYEFKDQHRIQLEVYMNQSQQPQIKRKPVIYLYAEEEVDAKIQIQSQGEFTFTYPEYEDGWDVQVSKNGQLEVDGKHYPYLFWEASTYDLNYKLKEGKLPGFIVASTELIGFFEEKLDKLNFNQQEKTDFITYWGPLLSQQPFAFVQFCVDEEYQEEVSIMRINPQADHMRRVFIKCSPLASPEIGIDIIPQELKGFERSGFTLLEWGGAILDLSALQG